MDDSGEASKKDESEQAAPGATPLAGGLECPTCGDRFPSKETLEEHLPTHKLI